MGASLGQKSNRRGRSNFKPMCEINVTPFVDVMLVLLIVFMITAPLLTVGIEVDLPKTQANQLDVQKDPIIVSVTFDGKLFVKEDEVSEETLIEKLLELTSADHEQKIYIKGDEKIPYGKVLEVMGKLTVSGFDKVGLIAKKPVKK